MGSAAPWTALLWELVQVGPVPKSLAIARMAALVPPGRAYRKGVAQHEWSLAAARLRSKSGRRVNDTKTRRRGEEANKDLRIRQGGDVIAGQAVWTQTRNGHIEEFRDEEGITMLRPGPMPWAGPGRPRRGLHRGAVMEISRNPSGRVNPMTPATVYIRQRIAQGPAPLSALIAEAAEHVPPERAQAAYDQWLKAMRRQRGYSSSYRVDPEKSAQRLRLGAEQITAKSIRSGREAGRLSIEDRDGVPWVIQGTNPWPPEG